MRSVFSIEPEGITRACPMVPLMSRNISATQSHAMISRWTRLFNGSAPFLVFFCGSVFTVHRHRRLSGMRISRPLGVSPVRRILANFQLHKTGRINACVARGAEFSFRVPHRLFQGRIGQISQGIGDKEEADLVMSVRGGEQLL